MYTTTIKAVDPQTGEMKTWGGPNVPAVTREGARKYCDTHGLGYCEISDKLVSEIGTKSINDHRPDWDNRLEFNKIKIYPN